MKVKYTSGLQKRTGFAGLTHHSITGPTIEIDFDHIEDVGLLEHEEYHCRKWKEGVLQYWWWWAKISFSAEAKYREEIEAYAVQLREYHLSGRVKYDTFKFTRLVFKFAQMVCQKYGLPTDVTKLAAPDLNDEIKRLVKILRSVP